MLDRSINEIERQRYYMNVVKEKVEQKSRELGRPLFMTVKTFGCAMIPTGTI